MTVIKDKWDNIKEAIREALAELPPDGKPDALLFLEREEEFFDFDIPQMIWGLPVFYNSRMINYFARNEPKDVPWIPIWKDRKKEPPAEYLEYFNETYIEHAYKNSQPK